ncbi:hypothetical protein [Deinococcus sp. RL]|uniref:hypothetical protein n=1 Tax=Deinococcus sp. RL TaxID=1489678 RepID=UPI001268C6B2|nr:hypothetical protein [Deinococcus sp. RL]
MNRLCQQSAELWVSNGLVGLSLLLVFLLLGEPLRGQRVLEARPDYPRGAVVLKPEGFPSGQQDGAAKAALARLEEAGALGFWAALESRSGQQPRLPISASLVGLGVVQLWRGHLPTDSREVLSLAAGPYPVGTRLQEKGGGLRVTGEVAIPWIAAVMGDTTVLEVQNLNTLRPDQIPTLVLAASAGRDAERWKSAAQRAFGLSYEATPLSAYLSRATLYMEHARAHLQRKMTVLALMLLLMALLARLHLSWYRRRERLRVERMLGRSERTFLLAWVRLSLSRWLWGAGAAAALALLLSLTGRLSLPGKPALLLWLAVCGAGLALTAWLGLSLRHVPLGRPGLERRSSWTAWSLPALLTVLLVAGIPLLGADAARLWLEQGAVVRGLGANTLVAMTLPSARRVPTVTSCPAQTACVPVGWSRVDLWPPDLRPDEPRWSSLGRFRPQDAPILQLRLREGRWPRDGQREAVVNLAALRELRQGAPTFGLGSTLLQGYRVVGVAEVPPHSTASLFADMQFYDAGLFLPWTAPGLETPTLTTDELFLSPLGTSALLLREVPPEKQASVQTHIRAQPGGEALEFYRPAQYALDLTRSVQGSLLWLAGLLAGGLALATATYLAALHLVLAQRAREISIWRLLGLTVAGVRRRLGRTLLTVLGSAALTGVALALLWKNATLGLTALLSAGTAVVLLVSGSLSLWAVTRRLGDAAIDRTYREAS